MSLINFTCQSYLLYLDYVLNLNCAVTGAYHSTWEGNPPGGRKITVLPTLVIVHDSLEVGLFYILLTITFWLNFLPIYNNECEKKAKTEMVQTLEVPIVLHL